MFDYVYVYMFDTHSFEEILGVLYINYTQYTLHTSDDRKWNEIFGLSVKAKPTHSSIDFGLG